MNASRSPLRLTGALAVALALAGCASVPDLGPRPAPRAAGDVAATRSFGAADAAPARAWPADQWWSAYGDPQLAGLIDEGLKNSPDMAAAAARFRRAQGMAQQAGGALLPSIDANGTASVDKQSYNNGIPKEFVPKGWQDRGGASIGAAFDLDLWGRNRASLAAATSEARAAQIDAEQARLMLTTGIADLYADLARLYALRDISKQTLDLRSATNRLVADRERNGLDTRGSVRQADATVASARAELSAADEAIALRRNQIAALIGAGPDRALNIARPQLATLAPRALPADVTTDLIGRRPDIAAARERTEAAASRIKVARADFFPAIRLSALIGVQSLGLNNLVESDSTYGSVGPAISLPIFHGGALSGAYRGARGSYDEAVASYDGTVLTAYREVADALTSQRALTQRLTDARAAVTAAEDAYAIARQRYEGGLSTYIDVLNVEDRLLVVRQSVAELDARAFALDVALVRALGGGFAGPAPASKEDPNG